MSHSAFINTCKTKITLLVILISISLSSCITYSFSGASIPPEAKNIAVKTFANNASLVNPTLSSLLTEELKSKIQSQSNLTLTNFNADLTFEGEITRYYTQPIAIQGNQSAALNRLTIAVTVRYTNRFNEKDNFEQTFSRYLDYDSSKNLSEVENELIKQINELLIEDIFNKAFVNW